MLRDLPSHNIKNFLLLAFPTVDAPTVRTVQVRFIYEVFELLRVDCHDFFPIRLLVKVGSAFRGHEGVPDLPRGRLIHVRRYLMGHMSGGL